MTLTIGIVLLVLLLLVLIIFFVLKREVLDINNKCKVYFTRKAQEYTDQINRNEENEVESSSIEEKNSEKNNEIEANGASVIYLEKKANYEIDDLLQMMKEIDQKFNLDNVKLIKLFIKEFFQVDEEQVDKYNALKQMKEYIDDIGIYQIIICDDDKYIEKITKDLRLIDEDSFSEYISIQGSFQVEEFYNYLNYEIGRCDPTIYVYVGEKGLNYNDIDDHIETIYSDDVYKGLKIVYLNKLYDFSLS